MENNPNPKEVININEVFGEREQTISGESSPSPLIELSEEGNDDNIFSERWIRTQHLCDMALVLFDQTQPLHGMGDESRGILEKAIKMRSLSIIHGKNKKPYQTTLELVQSQTSVEPIDKVSSTEEFQILAAVLVLYQRKIKPKDIAQLNLSTIQERQLLTIVALMRIVMGLDHSKSGSTFIQKVEIAQDGVWIIVDGPRAAFDAIIAQLNTTLWIKIGYPDFHVLESAEALIQLQPFPKPQEQIGIQSDDVFSEAGRKVMRFHFAQMLRHEDGTRLGEDIEALHDMRVATRRLRAAFEVFGEAFEPGVLKIYLKGLRATGRALGSVRDLDVFMEKAQVYLETLPVGEKNSLDALMNAWHEQRTEARNRMISHLDSQEYAAFKRKFNVFLNTPYAGINQIPIGQPTPCLVSELAPLLIYTHLAIVRAFDPFLVNAPIERLHSLRIEFKKLRYTVEYFREVLGKKAEMVIDELKLLQDHLGDLNDAQVATQLIREFIDIYEPQQAELPISERQNLEGVVNYMAARHAERYRLMAAFQGVWKHHFNNQKFRRNLAQAVSVL